MLAAIHVSVPSKIRSERFTRLYGCIEDLLVRVKGCFRDPPKQNKKLDRGSIRSSLRDG